MVNQVLHVPTCQRSAQEQQVDADLGLPDLSAGPFDLSVQRLSLRGSPHFSCKDAAGLPYRPQAISISIILFFSE
jgi:hypothetical protein